MANCLIGRRVKFQDVDKAGEPVGDPSWGVVVSDDHAMDFNNSFDTLEELNEAIEEVGILGLVTADFEVADKDHPAFKDSFLGADPSAPQT